MKLKRGLSILLLCVLAFQGYQQLYSTPQQGVPPLEQLISFALSLEGIPYRTGGKDRKGFDCSGLTYYIFKEQGLEIPRDSRSQSLMGKGVKKADLLPGDLVFFKGRNLERKDIGHVALVTKSEEGKVYILHATNRGVVLDGLEDMSYYRQRYIEARRLGLWERTEN